MIQGVRHPKQGRQPDHQTSIFRGQPGVFQVRHPWESLSMVSRHVADHRNLPLAESGQIAVQYEVKGVFVVLAVGDELPDVVQQRRRLEIELFLCAEPVHLGCLIEQAAGQSHYLVCMAGLVLIPPGERHQISLANHVRVVSVATRCPGDAGQPLQVIAGRCFEALADVIQNHAVTNGAVGNVNTIDLDAIEYRQQDGPAGDDDIGARALIPHVVAPLLERQ